MKIHNHKTAFPNIKILSNDGFSLAQPRHAVRDVALLSLRIGLKAYFSTYQAFKHHITVFDKKMKLEPEDMNRSHNTKYCEHYAETIVHLQHFAELACKGLLRAEHPLLVVDASNQPTILYKLLKGQPVPDTDYAQLKTLEFRNSLERLCQLIRNKQIGRSGLDFILRSKEALDELNNLRNRVWHRGTYILRYPSLDNFICRYIFPFVDEMLRLSEFSGGEHVWKYKPLNCKVDPIVEILNDIKRGKYNLIKCALLKELGRAAFENPISGSKALRSFNQKIEVRAKHAAGIECEINNNSERLRVCPVCGVESLVVYDETLGPEDLGTKLGGYDRSLYLTYQVKCSCCTFEINHNLENPSKFGLPIEDYWYSREM